MNTPTVEELGQRAVLARKEGRLSEALRDANDTVTLCRQVGTQEKLVRALMFLGQLERDMEQQGEALQHYEEAVSISRTEDAPLRFAHTVRHLADLYCNIGNLESAAACYQEAFAVYRNSSDTSSGDLANAIRGFAVLKDMVGSNDEARILWEEARDLYASLGVDEGVEECNARLKP